MEVSKKHIDYFDDVYKILFKDLKKIKRSEKDTKRDDIITISDIKDKEMGIDVTLELLDGTPITIQEKSRNIENDYLKNNYDKENVIYDFPIEHWNKPPQPKPINSKQIIIPEKGEYFKSTPQFHAVYYLYPNPFTRCYIINTGVFRLWLSKNRHRFKPRRVNVGQCSWYAIPLEIIIEESPESVYYDSIFGYIPHPYIRRNNENIYIAQKHYARTRSRLMKKNTQGA